MAVVYELKYPWDRWTNGQTWKVTQRADFTCYGRSFAGVLYSRAKIIDMSVTTSVFEYEYGDDVVIFQFYDAENIWKPNLKAMKAWRDEQEKHRRSHV